MLLSAWRGFGALALPSPTRCVSVVRWDIVGKFSSGGVTTVTLSRPAHHVRRRSFQLATPCNSKYLSSAINSLQLRRGSRVTSPVSHSTSNKIELFFERVIQYRIYPPFPFRIVPKVVKECSFPVREAAIII